MRLEPSDPDIETIVTRIERKDINLQPEFQRGEVWGRSKQQRLIDSILRDWHIPPIHVIELLESRKQEVLDGQQRLAAIRDFVRGDFTVDGGIDPIDPAIMNLDGLRYRELPDQWRRRFNQFTLRVFRVVDYRPEEPGELFFRLNQPTSLTAAEQRNAFFGPVRSQVKELVEYLAKKGIDKELLGFSNSRMAYDDIMARVAVTVQRNTLTEKLTAGDLIKAYRSEEKINERTIHCIRTAIDLLSEANSLIRGHAQFNKATLYSWFLFLIKSIAIDKSEFGCVLFSNFIRTFESDRALSSLGLLDSPKARASDVLREKLFATYLDRASARVADVSSVVLRDAVIWFEFDRYIATNSSSSFSTQKAEIDKLYLAIERSGSPFEEDLFARSLVELGWGNLL